MPELTVNGESPSTIHFAEAFDMRADRDRDHGADRALGDAGSHDDDRICHLGDRMRLREASVESTLSPKQTAGRTARRPCAYVCGFSTAELQKATAESASAASACLRARARPATRDWTQATTSSSVGDAIRFFGDGWQIAKRLGARSLLARAGHGRRVRLRKTASLYLTKKAVGGGNLIRDGREPRRRPSEATGGGGGRRCERSRMSSCRSQAA